MDALILTTSILVVIVTAVYSFFKYKFSYWSKRNVEFIPPKIPYGNIKGICSIIHEAKLFQLYYNRMKGKGPIGGIFFFTFPVVLALDLDLIKNILIKDFNYFQARNRFYNERDDPLSAHLIHLDGERWKALRHKLTPTFSTGKMKFMFPTIVEVAEQFHQCLSNLIVENDEVEMSDLLARYTTDVIGSCAFGINCNSLADPNAQFRVMGNKVFSVNRHSTLVQFFMATFVDLARTLRMKNNFDDVTDFFLGIVRKMVEYRESSGIHRNDFMDLLIDIKNNNVEDSKKVGKEHMEEIAITEIAAQSYVFFLAGFKTTSSTLSFCIFELSLNMELQAKARHEIETVLKKHDGKLTYEAMMDMHLIDRIISESLRKYPPSTTIARRATNAYQIPNTNVTLEKASLIIIPVYAIHHDNEFFPEPEIFDPNRFLPEEVKKRHNLSFLAFGDGPRSCIAHRFARMKVRVGLITLLKSFEITTCSKSIVPLVYSNERIVLSPKGGLFFKIRAIDDSSRTRN